MEKFTHISLNALGSVNTDFDTISAYWEGIQW